MGLRDTGILEVGLLIDIEIDVDGVERNQGGQGLNLSGSALDQIPFGDLRSPHSARNWSSHTGEFKIQFRSTKRRLGGSDASFGFVADCGAPVVLFGGHAIIVVKAFGALKIALRPRTLRLRLRKIAL